MRALLRARLVVEALWHLARYDVVTGLFGVGRIHVELAERKAGRGTAAGMEPLLCASIARAASLYWKRVQCLQRSVATVRLLRTYGIPAEVVIGYRTAPFFSHAWVEVDGRVVNDSQEYAARMYVLDRI